MPYEIGTASNHSDLFARLRTFLTTAGPTGPGWTELAYEAGPPTRMMFEAPGLSGTEEIHIGFRLYENIPGDTFGLYQWMSQSYDSGLDLQVQPGDSGDRFHTMWDQAMPYWFYANGQRCIVVTKVSTVYSALYIGKFLQYGTAGEYGLPYYHSAQWYEPVRFSSINEGVRNFWDPGPYGLMLNPNGTWYSVGNWYEQSGEAWLGTNINAIWPYASMYSVTYTRFRELRNNIDDSYTIYPLILGGNSPSGDLYGEIDGAFAISGFSLGSEDTITIGGDTYDVFQNMHRTGRMYYCAIKRA